MRTGKIIPLYIFVLAIALTGCGGSASDSGDGKTLLSQEGTKTYDASSSGKVTGTVHFEGTVPEPKLSSIRSFSECAALHKEKVYVNDVLVQDGKLQNVFVYIKSGLEDYTFEAPKKSKLLDQIACIYVPHVIGVQVNQRLNIKNSDITLHNVHSHSKEQKSFNIGMPVQGMITKRVFTEPEIMIPLTCDVHRWMKSYVGVVPHPFYEVTGSNGSFSLKGLPAGNYTIEAWHEVYGTQSQTITLADGESKAIDFTFSP